MNWQRNNNNFMLISGRHHVATVFCKGDTWHYTVAPEQRPCPLDFASSSEAKHWCIKRIERCYPELLPQS